MAQPEPSVVHGPESTMKVLTFGSTVELVVDEVLVDEVDLVVLLVEVVDLIVDEPVVDEVDLVVLVDEVVELIVDEPVVDEVVVLGGGS